MRGEERRVTDESRDPGLSSVSRSPSSDELGPGHWPPATLGPPVSTVQCVQCSTHCTVVTPATSLHPQSPSVCQQLWKQPDVSYKVTEISGSRDPCEKDWLYLTEIGIVNDIDEEFYLWISWPWQSSWHCKYLLTWKKNVCSKNISCTEHFWDESYGHVRLTQAWVGNLLMWSEISSATMLITKWPWHKTLMWWKNIRLIKIFSAAA